MTDREYQISRGRLVEGAARYANATVGKSPKRESERYAWGETWNNAFHAAMNTLSWRKGLIDDALYSYCDLKAADACPQ